MPRVSKPQSDKTPVELAADVLRGALRPGASVCPTCGRKSRVPKGEPNPAFDKALRSFIATPKFGTMEELREMGANGDVLTAYRKVYVRENFGDD